MALGGGVPFYFCEVWFRKCENDRYLCGVRMEDFQKAQPTKGSLMVKCLQGSLDYRNHFGGIKQAANVW